MPDQYFESYVRRFEAYKGGAWCYEDGCVYRGLVALDSIDPAGPWFGHLERLIAPQVAEDGTLAGYDIEEFNIDNILTGRVLFVLADRTGDPRYMKAAQHLADQLARHPRTETGNYWHKLRYPHQVWLDGLYMGLPFQIEYGQRTGVPELVGDAVNQFVSALRVTYDPASDLYMHGYDESRQQRWPDPETGRSPALWSRALGWMAMALADVIELIGPKAAEAAGLIGYASDLAQRMRQHQRPDGRWYQVTDMPDLEGNYPEASATAMMACFYLAGARLGIPGCDAAIGNLALDGLLKYSLREGEDGRMALHDVCQVAGLGGFDDNYRDGTPGYYLSEPLAPDDAKGVGPLMMAVAERRLAQMAGNAAVAHTA